MFKRIEIWNGSDWVGLFNGPDHPTFKSFGNLLTFAKIASVLNNSVQGTIATYPPDLIDGRHFFTEKGWKQTGKNVLSMLNDFGIKHRVVGKPKKKSNIFYSDASQAIIRITPEDQKRWEEHGRVSLLARLQLARTSRTQSIHSGAEFAKAT